MKSKPKLISLDLSGISFKHYSDQKLGETLKELKTLEKLKVDEIKITKAGVMTILNSLEDNNIITLLSIQNLPLDYDEAIISSKVIKVNHLIQLAEKNQSFGPPEYYYYQTFYVDGTNLRDFYDQSYKIPFFKS